MSDALIYLVSPIEGVCIGGRWNGWLMRKHADGRWMSVRKLETANPIDDLPRWVKVVTRNQPNEA
jgi:hypothetical protein